MKTRKLVCMCGEFSANAGDYFMARKDKEIVCGECGENMSLIETQPHFQRINDDTWISGLRVHVINRHPAYSDLADETSLAVSR